MPVSDWLELKTLKLLSQHTISIVAAALSFFLVTKVIKYAVGAGPVAEAFEYVDEAILLILFLWFTYQMLLLLWKGRVKWGNGNELLSLVA